MIDSGRFKPLQRQAREELATQIDGEPDATRLAAVGFGWDIAFQIVRQMQDGGNASVLRAYGLSASLASAIADAIGPRSAPVVEQSRPTRTMRGKHMANRSNHVVR